MKHTRTNYIKSYAGRQVYKSVSKGGPCCDFCVRQAGMTEPWRKKDRRTERQSGVSRREQKYKLWQRPERY